MSRTPMNENLSRNYNQQAQGWQQQAQSNAEGDIGKFRQNEKTIERGGNVAPNPFEQADYLANQNRLQAGALQGEDNVGKEQLQDVERRSGGLNGGATRSAIEGLALGKMRTADQLTAQRQAGDYKSNIAYQQWAAGLPLDAARPETQLFADATAGRNQADKSLTDYGLQQQKEWYNILQQSINAGKAAASAGVGAATGGAGIGGFGEG